MMNKLITNFSMLVVFLLHITAIIASNSENISKRSTNDQPISREFGAGILDDEITISNRRSDSINIKRKVEKISSPSFSSAQSGSSSFPSSPPPPPPEIIKFELSDAKEPDEATKAFFRKIREQMMLDMQKSGNNVTDTYRFQMQMMNHTMHHGNHDRSQSDGADDYDEAHDQGGHESQKVKIYVPLRQGKRKARKSTNFLPQEIQKVISALLKDQPNQRQTKQSLHREKQTIHSNKQQYQDNVVSGTVSTPKNVYYYGDKIPQSSSTGAPLNIETNPKSYKNVYSKGAIQLFSPQQDPKQYQPSVEFQPIEVIKVIPQIDYAIQKMPQPDLEQDSNYHPKFQYIQPIRDESNDDSYLQKQEQQEIGHHHHHHHHHHSHNPQSEHKFLPTITPSIDDSKYEALTALVGKNPVDQLQGLTYLLSSELLSHPNHHQNLVKSPSEDNRAPITFPAKSDSYNQPEGEHHHYQQQSNDVNDESKYEYNAVNNNDYDSASGSGSSSSGTGNDNGDGTPIMIPSSTYRYAHKEYTPVTELPEQNHLHHELQPYHHHHHHHQRHPEHQMHNSIQPIESVEPAKIVHITTPASIAETSYKTVHAVGLSPNYKGIIHDDNGLQYAARYAFGYRVRDFHTGNDFGHRQNRDIDGVTRGEYHILLPDGRVQNVRYLADDTGFHADVNFESGH